MSYKNQINWLKENSFQIAIEGIEVKESKSSEQETTGSIHDHNIREITASVTIGDKSFFVKSITSTINEKSYDAELKTYDDGTDVLITQTISIDGVEHRDTKVNKLPDSSLMSGFNMPSGWHKLIDKIEAKNTDNISLPPFHLNSEVSISDSEIDYFKNYVSGSNHIFEANKGNSKAKKSVSDALADLESIQELIDEDEMDQHSKNTNIVLMLNNFSGHVKEIKAQLDSLNIESVIATSYDLDEFIKEIELYSKFIIDDFKDIGELDKEKILDLAKIYQEFNKPLIKEFTEKLTLNTTPKEIRALMKKQDITAEDLIKTLNDIKTETLNDLTLYEQMIHDERQNTEDAKNEGKLEYDHQECIDGMGLIQKGIKLIMDDYSSSQEKVRELATIDVKIIPLEFFDSASENITDEEFNKTKHSDLNIALNNAPKPIAFIRLIQKMSSEAQDNLVYYAMKNSEKDIGKLVNRQLKKDVRKNSEMSPA